MCVCVCVGGGGGGGNYSLLTFIYRSPREEDAELCRPGQDNNYIHHHQEFFTYFMLFMSIIFSLVCFTGMHSIYLLSYFSGCMLLS